MAVLGVFLIGKKWIYSDTEQGTFHRQESGPSQRTSAALKSGVVSFYRLGLDVSLQKGFRQNDR